VTSIRLALIGAGWITGIHLQALARLGRAELVGVTARTLEHAEATAARWGGRAFADTGTMLDATRPDACLIAVPPDRAVAAGMLLVERGIPFLIEKPLSADEADGPVELDAAIRTAGLVVAVGYQLRGLDALPEVRALLADRPPHLVLGRWMGETPSPAWWHRTASGGGQVIEQATHLFDLARALVGEASVVAATSVRAGDDPTIEVADATTALLRFETGALGTFAVSRRLARSSIGLEFASDGQLVAIEPVDGAPPGTWRVRVAEASFDTVIPPRRNPYETQAAAFLDAVEAGDPGRVLSTYADALRTDRLARAVVAATGAPG
jgi:Predicted dehydrogenases and related proteins